MELKKTSGHIGRQNSNGINHIYLVKLINIQFPVCIEVSMKSTKSLASFSILTIYIGRNFKP